MPKDSRPQSSYVFRVSVLVDVCTEFWTKIHSGINLPGLRSCYRLRMLLSLSLACGGQTSALKKAGRYYLLSSQPPWFG